jgi:hypothetical protein
MGKIREFFKNLGPNLWRAEGWDVHDGYAHAPGNIKANEKAYLKPPVPPRLQETMREEREQRLRMPPVFGLYTHKHNLAFEGVDPANPGWLVFRCKYFGCTHSHMIHREQLSKMLMRGNHSKKDEMRYYEWRLN